MSASGTNTASVNCNGTDVATGGGGISGLAGTGLDVNGPVLSGSTAVGWQASLTGALGGVTVYAVCVNIP